MKFARLLRTTAEDLPELQCLFHIYKHLKKQLKQLPARSEGKPTGADGQIPTGRTPDEAPGDAGEEVQRGNRAVASEASEEARFTAVLTDHLQRLNDRFLEREETCVIQLERLEAEAAQCTQAARATAAGGSGVAAGAGTSDGRTDETVSGAVHLATLKAIAEQRAQLYKRFVNFHGEVLLLVHWSVLAYTATVKILKKHHKRTGLLLRAPQLADLLSQPFCSSELMTGLARKAEACIQRLAEQLASSATSGGTTGGSGGGAAGPDGTMGGGPQVTVDQADAPAESPAAAEALGTAAAADDDSYGAAVGSSPSCSQSPGDLMTRRVGAAAADQPQPQSAVEATCAEVAAVAAETPRQRRERLQRRRQVQRPREQGEALVGGAGDGGGGAGAGARAIGGGGATFLRNLTRLSDNSNTSLSGPYVLEQLAELQHFVDKYDIMDDDDVDELEEEEDSGAVGTGGAAAAVAAATGGRLHATPPPPHHCHRSVDAGQADAAAVGPIWEEAAAVCPPGGGVDGGGTAVGPGFDAAEPERATAAVGTPGSPTPQELLQQVHPAQPPPSSPTVGGVDSLSLSLQRRRPMAEGDPLGASPPPQQQAQHHPSACTVPAAAVVLEDSIPVKVAPLGQPAPQQPHQQTAAQPPSQHQHQHQEAENRQRKQQQQPQHECHHQRVQHQYPPQHHTQQQQQEGRVLSLALAPWGLSSGSGSGSGSVPTADGHQPGQARIGAAPPQSSSGSAAATAGCGGGAGSVSVALSDSVFAGLTGGNPMGGRPPLEAGGANLLRRTQVALTMWEHLRANASTPSTVIDPTAGPKVHGQGDVLRGKRRRTEEGGGAEGEEVDSVADDSGSTSD